MVIILNATDVKNVVAMIEQEKRLVEVDAMKVLMNETEKIHALLYLDSLKKKFKGRGR